MTSVKGIFSSVFVAGLLLAAAACSSDSKGATFTPGDYAFGVLIDGYEASSLTEPPFSGYPDLYGFGDIEVADDGTITGSLELDYTPEDDGPGGYDITGLAVGNTFTFTAGDYEAEGIFTEDGTMEGTLTGPDGQEGVFFAFFGSASDMVVACGGMGWYVDDTPEPTSIRFAYDYSGYSPGIVFFNPDAEEYTGFFAGEDASGSFTGSVTLDDSNSGWNYYDPEAGDLLFAFKAGSSTTSTIEGEPTGTNWEFSHHVDDGVLQFNAGFAGNNDDYYLISYSYFHAHTFNCPGLAP